MITKRSSYTTGRISVKTNAVKPPCTYATGVQKLMLDTRKDGFLYVPTTYHPDQPARLALMLHGAGGLAEHGLSLLRQYADDYAMILVAPASRASSWDIISARSFGSDVFFIEQALALTFERYNINPAHIAIGGFSDGASYALCLGLTNGDLFSHIIAFSPGFAYTIEKKGRPKVFISHGTQDHILPIDPCSRRIVPQLQRQGLPVHYLEFDGEHLIPPAISQAAITWFLKDEQAGTEDRTG